MGAALVLDPIDFHFPIFGHLGIGDFRKVQDGKHGFRVQVAIAFVAVDFLTIQAVDQIATFPLHTVFVELIQGGGEVFALAPPIAFITFAQAYDGASGEFVFEVIAVVFEDVYFTGARERPAHIFVRFLDRAFVVLGTENPPGGELTGQSVVGQAKAGGPATFDEFFSILRADPAGYIARRWMLVAVFVQVITGEGLVECYNAQFEGSIAHFAGAVITVGNIAMGLVIYPNALVLPILRIEGLELVQKIDNPFLLCR